MIWLSILLAFLVGSYRLHLSVLWILLYMPILLMLAQGIGWIAAGLHVFVRDTMQALQLLVILWMWFTPVFYSIETVPQEFRFLFQLNPMVVIVTGYRNSLLNLNQPDMLQIALVLGSSLAIFVIGALFFRQAKPAFPDVL